MRWGGDFVSFSRTGSRSVALKSCSEAEILTETGQNKRTRGGIMHRLRCEKYIIRT